MESLGLQRGVTHAEFLKSHADGRVYFIEIAARVGGAYISDVVEAASGINLWRGGGRLERGEGEEAQRVPHRPHAYTGAHLSFARHRQPPHSPANNHGNC